MEATVLYGARDVRFEDRPAPTIIEPTDAIIRLPFTCICGSDLWPYRGIQPVAAPAPMGHECPGDGRTGACAPVRRRTEAETGSVSRSAERGSRSTRVSAPGRRTR